MGKHGAERVPEVSFLWLGAVYGRALLPTGRRQLREICCGLAASKGKLHHLVLSEAPARSTLAYANEHRPCQLYRTMFDQPSAKCLTLAARLVWPPRRSIFAPRCLIGWSFVEPKGVKLHLLLDNDGYLLSFAVITEGKRMRCVSRGRCDSRREGFWCLTRDIRIISGL